MMRFGTGCGRRRLVAMAFTSMLHLFVLACIFLLDVRLPPKPPEPPIEVVFITPPVPPQARPAPRVAAPPTPPPRAVPATPPTVQAPQPQVAVQPQPVPAPPQPAIPSPPSAPVAVAPALDTAPRPAAPTGAVAAAPPVADAVPAAPAVARGPSIVPPSFDADYLHNPTPRYPPAAARLRESGRVLLSVAVNAAGLPERVEIAATSGSPRLDQAALDTVKRWRFVPARQGDRAVAASVNVPLVFRLDE